MENNNPYRQAPNERQWESLSEWNNISPHKEYFNCPACGCNNKKVKQQDGTLTVNGNGKAFLGCLGIKQIIRKWFSKNESYYVCPLMAHLHIQCWACKLKFIMWAECQSPEEK